MQRSRRQSIPTKNKTQALNLISLVSSSIYFGTVDEMMKGFRFHPTDAEAIELLWDKLILDRDSIVQVGDSLVRVITQLEDICEFEPGELPGRSELESGDKVWYFFCSPRYKYRNSKRKNRVTRKGYWNPTGKPREIVTTYDGKEISGSRQTLTFYQGRVSGQTKSENKTSWVIHEFQLSLSLPNQTTLLLCKLKKKYGKIDVLRGGGGQSSQGLPFNLENHGTKIAIPKEQLNPHNEPSTESEAFNECSGIQSQFITNELQDDDQFVDSLFNDNDELYSNQPCCVNEFEGCKEGFGDLITRSSEHDNSSGNSILIANEQTYSKGGSASHFITSFAENEGSCLAFENRVAEDSIPMKASDFDELLRKGIFMAELFPMPEAPENSDGVQNHRFIFNEQDDEFWNSIFFTTEEVEAYPEVIRSKQQDLATSSEGFNFSTISTMETPNDPCLSKPLRKRARIETEGLSSEEDIEEARGREKKYSSNRGAFEYDGSLGSN